MSRAKRRAPAPHREQSDVNPPCQVSHLREQVRVPGKVDDRRSLDQKTQAFDLRAEREAGACVPGLGREDVNPVDEASLSWHQFFYVRESVLPKQITHTARNDQAHAFTEHR